MFIVLLRFSENKARAGEFMDGHKAWIQRGFENGTFVLMGSLQPNLGGALVAHDTTLSELESFVGEDPFVVEKIVTPEILEITASRADDRLSFLIG
ncbi:hypothetical protein GR183_07335 [Stappia sp. GBMRC 2046]|uniref:YCII-related domain-containing protein n=1 Tax=Stappia sediminis TaxID=2692190 RepID=A0A7X3LTA6_9HYPH|nr:hypothetical protein [Stappia sediminis]MXN64714.1 hypothetical protein [Stappia sediminis]